MSRVQKINFILYCFTGAVLLSKMAFRDADGKIGREHLLILKQIKLEIYQITTKYIINYHKIIALFYAVFLV